MSISMFQASVPVFVQMLRSLRSILEKGAAHAQAKKIDEAVFLNARLSPDMFPLTKQVQLATDFAKGTAARLAAVEPPPYEDNETSFPALLARIDKTIAYVQTLKTAQIDGSEERRITRPIRGEPRTFTGLAYLLSFALPNFYFHVTAAYALLRQNGVEIGKSDFIGTLEFV